jgi:hypothetical protein
MTPHKDLNYHSFEVQEIIERVPKWTSRWGISSLFVVLCILLIVCSVVRLPLRKRVDVLLTINNPPLHLTNKPGNTINPLIKSNRVEKGDILVKNHLSGEYILAPYSGTLTGFSPTMNKEVETISILIPDVVRYHVQGKVPIKFRKLMKIGHKLKIIINSNSLNEEITVYGIIKEISPVAHNNELVFHGELNAGSNLLLKKDLLYSSKIKGINEVIISDITILNMLFGKIK